ncbi:uncharacterized protein LOC126795764 [Argentina anserina]|uniref:uncharacterized protein LOC126795764 n=1 Tax=Argentina anserina TaxID=57926 RepID=UPI0021762CFE|nr:uncharacterized protein LOC126795764 [Potentilla anserina]
MVVHLLFLVVYYLRAVFRFWSSRDDNTIQYFRIHWTYHSNKNSCHFNELYRILTWIRNAIRSNVEVFDLQLDTTHQTVLLLPSWFFHCPSLKSLLFDFGGNFLKWPSPSCFSVLCNLRVLKLKNVTLEGEDYFFKWISCSCNTFKVLHLEEVHAITYMTIESLSLESFSFVQHHSGHFSHLEVICPKLEVIHITWKFYWSRKRLLHICTPNLKFLKWGGFMLDHVNLGDLMYLEKAEIFLEVMTTLSAFYIHTDQFFRSYRLKENAVSTHSMNYWASQNLSCINRLEEVRIELSGANEGEFEYYRPEN